MGTETIKHTCGHETKEKMYGSHKERDAKVAAMSQHPCPHCRAKEAEGDAAAQDLPNLQGSEKQIAWASDIRANILAELDALLAKATGSDAEREKVTAAYKLVKNKEMAKFWIDNRSRQPVQLIADAAKEI